MFELSSQMVMVQINGIEPASLERKCMIENRNPTGGTDLYMLEFLDEERTHGKALFLKNSHLQVPATMARFADAVDFYVMDNIWTFFTGTIAYVALWKLFFEENYIEGNKEFGWKILKHPLLPKKTESNVRSFIRSYVGEECTSGIELDPHFGLKGVISVQEEKGHIAYYTNGLVVFGMNHSDNFVKKIISFLQSYHRYMSEQK